ncbi:helix-turn-helix domain-containing protein [Streptomyces daliensis]|uniref:Helix-turn-helix domain-containing protein n=1 Tax=Streptomyces daliensis TaxID=299421 RepID=A0A8T4IST5_9ACTN|nr:helix-turn-helix domain-containing protein [Streptomyces daliensis]
MTETRPPSVRRRRLAILLGNLREAAGISPDAAAEHLGCHRSKISRLENAKLGVSLSELRDLLALYGVEDQSYVESLVQLAREARHRGWTRHLGAMNPSFVDEIDHEQTASYIRTYQPHVIAGLFQTSDYARAIYKANPEALDAKRADELVELRMQRQEVLHRDEPPRVSLIVGETALRNSIGGREVMKGQLEHLLSLSERQPVEIQALPFATGAHAGLTGAFVIYTFPTPAYTDVVCIEHLTGTLHLEIEEEVGAYTLAYDSLRSSALPARASRDLIHQVLHDL